MDQYIKSPHVECKLLGLLKTQKGAYLEYEIPLSEITTLAHRNLLIGKKSQLVAEIYRLIV